MPLSDENKYLPLRNLRNIWKAYSSTKTLKYGLPFVIFIIGGSFGLREWTQIRYMNLVNKLINSCKFKP